MLTYYIRRNETRKRPRAFWNSQAQCFIADAMDITYFATREDAESTLRVLKLGFTALRICCSCARHVEFRKRHPVQEAR